jgi:replication initiation and membrane attachment protein DnaB
MLSWLFGKDLNSYLNEEKKIRVKGINFVIKRINTLNHLEGAKVLKQTYDTYKTKTENQGQVQIADKKIIEHFSHVLVCGVVKPTLTYKKEDKGIHVDELFLDWDLVVGVYNEIMEFTYGKKKMKQLACPEKS